MTVLSVLAGFSVAHTLKLIDVKRDLAPPPSSRASDEQ